MYTKAKYSINKENLISGYFPSNMGVGQRYNQSPLLFSLFINNIKHNITNTYHGLMIAESYEYSIILFLLLYANDTLVLVGNEHQFQTVLDNIHEYCTMYNLCVNII